jgi:hypothetical protein
MANLPPSLAPQGFPLLGWHHLFDATAANRKGLWNQARRHLHPFPFPFLGLETEQASAFLFASECSPAELAWVLINSAEFLFQP